jgi:hypothetical protein
MQSNDVAVAALATDLDKMPSGEDIIQRLLTGVVLLQKKTAELEMKLDQVTDQMTALVILVDSDHAALMVLMGQRQAVAEGKVH